MDRDKRRSKEEEEQLDKKIALIREKNLKIEQRSKEVEADRASNTTILPKKPSTSNQNQPAKGGNKNKTWDREWDQGKTPADQWRENVPSIEHSGRLANSAPQHRRRDQNGQAAPAEAVEKLNKGRLEGRVTIDPEKAAGNKNRGGRRDQHNTNKHRDSNVDKLVKPNGAPRQEQRNRRSEKKTVENKESGNAPKEQKENQKKSRPRRENDRYAVRMVLKQLVDKIDKMERRQKRDEKREVEPKEIQEPKTETKIPISEDSNQKENVESDANQNVIQLTRERVLTVQST